MTTLYKKDGGKIFEWSMGSTPLLSNHEIGDHLLTICIQCSFGDDEERYYALFDTGARWTVISRAIAKSHPDHFFPLGSTKRIETRFGTFTGELHRCDIRILVDEGEDLITDITALVLDEEEWPYVMVVGFDAFLSKIRWACDPTIDNYGRLYFGLNEE